MHYLSDEWVEAANSALSHAERDVAGVGLTIVQHVIGARSYQITLTESSAELTVADESADGPNVLSFQQEWAIACQIAKGETDAHQAFLLGDVRFAGNVQELITNAPALEAIASALAPVMEQTTFPETFSA